ncbi:hypothetical protein G9A89_019927 [Geosiphon pyriformis]|nr:hypothetical protein G9A89_019927 [Geosiphon pyriformis]
MNSKQQLDQQTLATDLEQLLDSITFQYIDKLTELKFQQFSDQITSIILDHYLNITDSAWTSTELSFEEEIMLPVEF